MNYINYKFRMELLHMCNLKLVIVCLMIFITGCGDDFLSPEPKNSVSTINFFENEDEVEQALLGVYAKTQDMYELQFRLTEMRSDNTMGQWNEQNRGPHPNWLIDEFTMEITNVIVEAYWADVFEGIQRANTVINQANNVEFSNEEVRNQMIGEAKFLRAFYYFSLVRLFGKVPLVLDQVESPDDSFSTIEGRAEVETIYDQILADANDAANNLPASFSSTSDIGRATQGAARALLADVHMTLQNFQEARSNLEQIINSGRYLLLNDYSKIFDINNKNNAEIIFAIQYAELDNNRNLGSQFIYFFAPHNSSDNPETGTIVGDNAQEPVGLNLPTQSLINAYEPGDMRKDASIGKFVDPANGENLPSVQIAVGDTIFYAKKYDQPHEVFGAGNQNWQVYRYGQILLMMAEVINEVEGPTAEAYGFINQIRQRAGLNNLETGLSQSEFRDAVTQEQRVELALENDRWFDLLRKGIAKDVMVEHALEVKDIQPHFREPVYVIEDFKLLYPIPQREISLNPNLGQNPGWN